VRDYVFAKRGALVAGVGDEELAPAAADNPTVRRLSKDEKLARLKAWLATAVAAPARASDAKK
jgi:hypothetical protein